MRVRAYSGNTKNSSGCCCMCADLVICPHLIPSLFKDCIITQIDYRLDTCSSLTAPIVTAYTKNISLCFLWGFKDIKQSRNALMMWPEPWDFYGHSFHRQLPAERLCVVQGETVCLIWLLCRWQCICLCVKAFAYLLRREVCACLRYPFAKAAEQRKASSLFVSRTANTRWAWQRVEVKNAANIESQPIFVHVFVRI